MKIEELTLELIEEAYEKTGCTPGGFYNCPYRITDVCPLEALSRFQKLGYWGLVLEGNESAAFTAGWDGLTAKWNFRPHIPNEQAAYDLGRAARLKLWKKGEAMRVINLPAINRTVSLAAYVQAIKLAKANPSMEFKHGLTTWWPVTGAEVMRQFREGMNDRINQGVSYSERGDQMNYSAFSKGDELFPVARACSEIASGTIASLSNFSRYDEIDALRESLVNQAQRWARLGVIETDATWQTAWNLFKLTHDFHKTVKGEW